MGLKREIKNYLKEKVSPSRYKHILGVRKTAVKLGEKYYYKELKDSKKTFIEKLELAALMHDIDKGTDPSIQLKMIEKHKDKELVIIKNTKEIYHAFSGAIIAKEKFDIKDDDILNAIKYHTSGRKNMTIYDKIIYLADFIEPNRDFDGVKALRHDSMIDLDKALIKALKMSISFIKQKGHKVNVLTSEALDYLDK